MGVIYLDCKKIHFRCKLCWFDVLSECYFTTVGSDAGLTFVIIYVGLTSVVSNLGFTSLRSIVIICSNELVCGFGELSDDVS